MGLDFAGVNFTDRILHVGCGNSVVSESLWHDGYVQVTHLDLSPVVIEQVKARLNFTTDHAFVVGDLTALTFQDQAFDVVLDKGALDAVFTAGKKRGRQAIREIARVLRPAV